MIALISQYHSNSLPQNEREFHERTPNAIFQPFFPQITENVAGIVGMAVALQ